MRNCSVFVGQDDFLIEKNVLTDAKYGKKSASNTGNVKMEKMPKGSTVDFIIKDASDPYDKMPLNSMDIDRMTTNGTYFANQQFVCKDDFSNSGKDNRDNMETFMVALGECKLLTLAKAIVSYQSLLLGTLEGIHLGHWY